MRPALYWAALALAPWSAGCDCMGGGALAELVGRDGTVERNGPGRWQRAAVGDEFALGDAVRTGPRSGARLQLDEGAGLRLQENTVVRFIKGLGSRSRMRLGVDTGAAQIEAGDDDLWIETDLGLARIERGSRVALRTDPEQRHFEVLVGSAELEQAGAATISLRAGQHAEVALAATASAGPASPGTSPAAPTDPGASAAGATAAPAAGPQPGLPRGEAAVLPTGPAHADLSIAAGESPTIHDPSAPTAVRVRFASACPGAGVVELVGRARGSDGVQGAGSAVLVLGPGTWGYRVRCIVGGAPEAESRASGAIVVRRDAGSAPLARRVAHNVLDSDGRSYTVLYQNLLPRLTIRWADAPLVSGFTLHLESQGGGAGKVVRTMAASHSFASGDVHEGRYSFWFEAGDGSRSRRTSLRLGFDNAAPAAYLREVAGGAGGGARVSGVVEEGWSATIGGVPLPLDEQNRFVADLAPSGDDRAIAVRIAKPGRGVHYYVRQATAQ
ncbi:MAG: hypothetical protein HYY06_23760 [Deltaproteobacteria bacterium]|nr:hypothetical protein [Deltaproteobacteria bacterium]